MGNSKRLLLVYRNMPQQDLNETINIMLTPQFYTLKKEPLPIKYAFQAKNIAPSLFDGLLENTENYDYMVYKEGDSWVFIAYDLRAITIFLESKNIRVEKVGKIFFAQQALESFDAPVLLGAKDALVAIDNTVVLVPKSAVKEEHKAKVFNDTFTPSSGISLQQSFHSYLSQKQAIGLATLFTLFALSFMVEGWRYSASEEEIKAEISTLLEAYPALQSQYTRKNVAEKYKRIDLLERRKRDMIKSLAGMIFKGVKVESFKMDDKGFVIRFVCSDAKVVKKLRELSKKIGFKSAKSLTGNVLMLEEKL